MAITKRSLKKALKIDPRTAAAGRRAHVTIPPEVPLIGHGHQTSLEIIEHLGSLTVQDTSIVGGDGQGDLLSGSEPSSRLEESGRAQRSRFSDASSQSGVAFDPYASSQSGVSERSSEEPVMDLLSNPAMVSNPFVESKRQARLAYILDILEKEFEEESEQRRSASHKRPKADRKAYVERVLAAREAATSWELMDMEKMDWADEADGKPYLWCQMQVNEYAANNLMVLRAAKRSYLRSFRLSEVLRQFNGLPQNLRALRGEVEGINVWSTELSTADIDQQFLELMASSDESSVDSTVASSHVQTISGLTIKLRRNRRDMSKLAALADKQAQRAAKRASLLTAASKEKDELCLIVAGLDKAVVSLRAHALSLQTALDSATAFTQAALVPPIPVLCREEAVALSTETFRVNRPAGGSGTRVVLNPKSLLAHYSDAQLAVVYPFLHDVSGVRLDWSVIRATAVGQFLLCTDVVTSTNTMITKDGIFYESIVRISQDQYASTSSRNFFMRTATPSQLARFSADGGMLWDMNQVSLWLNQATHASITFAAHGAIPAQFVGIDFIKAALITQQSVEGNLARTQLFAGLLGSSGCSLTAFAVHGRIISPNDVFEALRNLGHAFSLFFGDDDSGVAWCPLLDAIVNVLVVHSAAQRSVNFLIFSLDLCLQQWGSVVQKLCMYQEIPLRVLDQRFAKSLLLQLFSDTRLKALDQQQFEAAKSAAFAVAPSVNILADLVKRRDDHGPSSTSSSTHDHVTSSGVCFDHLSFVLQLSPAGHPCPRSPCRFPHPTIDELRLQKPAILPMLSSKPAMHAALEQL